MNEPYWKDKSGPGCRYLGTVDNADYYWQWSVTQDPSLLVVEGKFAHQHHNHNLPYGFFQPGQGADLAKCVALHQERKAFWEAQAAKTIKQ